MSFAFPNPRPRLLIVGPFGPDKTGGVVAHVTNLGNSTILKESYELDFHDLQTNIFPLRDFIRNWKLFLEKCSNTSILYLNVSKQGSLYRKTISAYLSAFAKVNYVVAHLHSGKLQGQLPEKWFERVAYKLLLRRCDVIIVLSQEAQLRLSSLSDIKVFTVSNSSSDFARLNFSEGSTNFSTINLLPIAEKFAIYVGDITEEKGVLDLLKVWSGIFESTNYRLVMVGKLDQKLDLLRGGMSRDSNKESVKYLGHVKSYNLALLLRQSEFIILPSYSEGQPICLLEAISLSRPFVASKLEGICSIDPSNSFSENCTPGSQKELKEAIYKMIQRIEMNEFNHKEIRRVWESNFSPEVQSRNLLKIFNSLIQSK